MSSHGRRPYPLRSRVYKLVCALNMAPAGRFTAYFFSLLSCGVFLMILWSRSWSRLLTSVSVLLSITGLSYLLLNYTGFPGSVVQIFSPRTRLPPLYPEYREFERHLPQHDPNLPYPEGSKGKYFLIANHCRRECQLIDECLSTDLDVKGRGGATFCRISSSTRT